MQVLTEIQIPRDLTLRHIQCAFASRPGRQQPFFYHLKILQRVSQLPINFKTPSVFNSPTAFVHPLCFVLHHGCPHGGSADADSFQRLVN